MKKYRWIDPIESQLGMPFESFETAVGYWDAYRNPLAHGFDEISSVEESEILVAYGHLFGAIYRIMAQQMGFTGSLPESHIHI